MKEGQKLLHVYNLLYEAFGPQHWWPGETPLEVAVGAILTQNAAWVNVEKAISNLKREGCLTLNKLCQLKKSRLARLIRPAGYFNIKAERLKKFLDWVFKRYGSIEKMFDVPTPRLREELLSVKGIGPETADSILLYGGGHPVFVIDAYTRRILTRHYLARDSDDYETLQTLMVKNLKPDAGLYNEYHALIVRTGKDFCRKTNPKCSLCPLNGLNWEKGIGAGCHPGHA